MTGRPSLRYDHRWSIAVEGPDDKHVVGHIAYVAGFDLNRLQITDYGGIARLLEAIKVIEEEESGPIGIVLDANDHPDQRWQTVTDRLMKAGIEAPSQPDPNGTIIPGDELHPTVGIWMMPDNSSPGELEHFVAKMIPENDEIWPRSKAYIKDIPLEQRPFKHKTTRAKVHAWIATREEPGFMGQAISRGDLNTDATLCQTFIAWLTRLFSEPASPDPA